MHVFQPFEEGVRTAFLLAEGRDKLIARIYTPKTQALHNFCAFGPQNWIQEPSVVTTFIEVGL